ncbi:MAG TPA: transcriptional regulator [Tabrizicola sp.]|nr:transcriptional regulator [Tabrizicola sp.]
MKLRVGIASPAQMKARTLAIARGEIKVRQSDPKVWFNSIESFAKVLSERNRELLLIIARSKPQSLSELETLSGRAKPNLSRTLHTMARYGLVDLQKGGRGSIIPKAKYDQVELSVDLNVA